MTIDEAVGRILRKHVLLLVLVTLLPVAVLAVASTHQRDYMGSAVVQSADGPATSSTEADAISTRVAGLATTPRFIVAALEQAGVHRAVPDYAKNNIVTTRIGQSPVVRIDVMDSNRRVAHTVAESLARQVVAFMNSSDQTDITPFLKRMEKQRSALLAQRSQLTGQLTASPADPRVPIWQGQLSVVEQQIASLGSQESQLLIDHATQPTTVVVDAGGKAVLEPSRAPQQLALALVLGLALALATVAVVEMVSPTVPGPRALGRILDAPVLGRLRRGRRGDLGIVSTANAIGRAMRQRELSTAVLVAVHPRQQVPGLLPQRLASTGVLAHGSSPVRWRTTLTLPPDEEHECGVVVLMPSSVKRHHVDDLRDLLRSTEWPVVGIVATPGPRGAFRRALRRFGRTFRRTRPSTTVRRGAEAAPSSGAAAPEDASPAAPASTSRTLLRCSTVGLHVDVESELTWVTSMLEEALAGDTLRVGPTAPAADLRVLVERRDRPFDVRGWQVVTRGVHTDGTRVVMTDACGTGFDLCADPTGDRLTVRARWRPSTRARVAAALLPSRFHLLVRYALLQYPALWWAGVHGSVPLHASAIRLGAPHEDVVALLAGPGGVGKSTLLATELLAGGQATADNICVVRNRPDGSVEVSGLLEPLRLEGAAGRKMPHGRGEQAWTGRASDLVATVLVVVRRGRQELATTGATTRDEAARVLVGGTYAAGELRRYWAFAASLALGTGLGPVHPPIPEAARTVAERLPCTDLVLPNAKGTRLSEVLTTAPEARR